MVKCLLARAQILGGWGLVASCLVTGCQPREAVPTVISPERSAPTAETETAPLRVDPFSQAELDVQGCGMTLWLPEADPRTDGIYFFNGIESGSGRIKVADRVVPLIRQEGTGRAFYGQFNTQTFVSADNGVIAVVEVEIIAEEPESEVMELSGILRVERADQQMQTPVVGDAGC